MFFCFAFLIFLIMILLFTLLFLFYSHGLLLLLMFICYVCDDLIYRCLFFNVCLSSLLIISLILKNKTKNLPTTILLPLLAFHQLPELYRYIPSDDWYRHCCHHRCGTIVASKHPAGPSTTNRVLKHRDTNPDVVASAICVPHQ